MKITLDIPDYDVTTGLKVKWEEGFEIITNSGNGSTTILANRAGLISLANILLNLSQETVPSGSHIHLDDLNSLESGSVELILVKK